MKKTEKHVRPVGQYQTVKLIQNCSHRGKEETDVAEEIFKEIITNILKN